MPIYLVVLGMPRIGSYSTVNTTRAFQDYDDAIQFVLDAGYSQLRKAEGGKYRLICGRDTYFAQISSVYLVLKEDK